MMRLLFAAWRHGRVLAPAFVFGGSFLALTAPAPGCKDEGIGDPCTPEQEYNPDFLGFDEKEVNVESKSFQCRTRLCLVNHFRGRVSCPYGQGTDGSPPANAKACTVPGTTTPIVGDKDQNGNYIDTKKQSSVQPQCLDRSANNAVYCSCRCAGLPGQDTSGQPLCTCPDGFQCQQLVTSIGAGTNEGLTGSYCIKANTVYDATTACTQGSCDPNDKTKTCQ
jgi:hypothetical protein